MCSRLSGVTLHCYRELTRCKCFAFVFVFPVVALSFVVAAVYSVYYNFTGTQLSVGFEE